MRKRIQLHTGRPVVVALKASLKARNLNFEKLAKIAKIGRSHLSQIINGSRDCTEITWSRLEPYLSLEERQNLKEAFHVEQSTQVEQ